MCLVLSKFWEPTEKAEFKNLIFLLTSKITTSKAIIKCINLKIREKKTNIHEGE